MINSKIILKEFNGNSEAPEDCDPQENYWLLIGRKGKIVKEMNSRSRVLVQFNESVSELGLHCHNEVPNSLYILLSDIEFINE